MLRPARSQMVGCSMNPPGRCRHHHGRPPAPDVGRPVVQEAASFITSSAGPARWLWLSGRHRRQGGAPDKQVVDIDGDGSF